MTTTPNDRNQAARQQLLKKREQAQQARKALAPGEMVDDALARGVAAAGKWFRAHGRGVQFAILGLIAAGAAYWGVDSWQTKRAEAATSTLVKAERDERGRIGAPESKTESRRASDDDETPVFKSVEEKRKAALADYRAVVSKHPGSGAAILARLGEAGVLLDQRDYDGALAAYRDVKSSKLAAADTSVRARATEGIGLANEGKKDFDGALGAFRELQNTDVRGYRELGMFQQARMLAARADGAAGDTGRALELLKSAREKLRTATVSGPYGERPMFPYLQTQVDDLLRALDPAAIPPTPVGGSSGKTMSPEQLQRLREEFQRRIAESKDKPASTPAAPPVGSTPPGAAPPASPPASSGSH